jgi:K+-transporting ATPase ATPase C chain
MLKEMKTALAVLTVMTFLTGALYPLVVTGVAQVLFPVAANGSLIEHNGKPIKDGAGAVGSALIGQPFSDPRYFWGRPSATSPYPYNASASAGSNQGPLNPALADAVKDRVKALRDADPDNTAPVPVDLVTASGSGLDPHISPAAAEYQAGRVARARGINPGKMRELIVQSTESRQFGFLGEPRVNVLKLNLALDELR